ncbi:MAG TPA: nucleotidyltransferase domain-containing protein [Usitatibacteraceae bacterium]
MSHHPIDPTIRAEIMARLAGIEAEHNVRVLFACESGSRGWGFASQDCDYDMRFLS